MRIDVSQVDEQDEFNSLFGRLLQSTSSQSNPTLVGQLHPEVTFFSPISLLVNFSMTLS